MTVPTAATYSLLALIAAHQSFMDLIDSNSGAGNIKIRSSTDVLLAQVPLTYPCGAINLSTGRLTLNSDGRDESANASGIAAYAEFCDSAGVVYLSLPAQEGTDASSGKIVINTLSIEAGLPVGVTSATVG